MALCDSLDQSRCPSVGGFGGRSPKEQRVAGPPSCLNKNESRRIKISHKWKYSRTRVVASHLVFIVFKFALDSPVQTTGRHFGSGKKASDGETGRTLKALFFCPVDPRSLFVYHVEVVYFLYHFEPFTPSPPVVPGVEYCKIYV